jgi:PEGA domain
MRLKSLFIPMTFVAALAFAVPASAQHGAGGGHGGGGFGGGHMSGGHSGGGHMSSGGHSSGGHFSGGRPGGGQVGSRPSGGHFSHGSDRGFHGGFDHGGRFHGGFGGPFVHVRPIRPFHGSFFAFRPRFDLGFGFFAGYPFPYPWGYFAPYPYYQYDYPYDYPDGATYDPNSAENSDSSTAAPAVDQRNLGGISFDVTPADAQVYVDGTYVGTAKDFSPSSAPLTLTPRKHQVVIQKAGYQTMTFESDVPQGQVIPYQGKLQRQ